MSVKQVCCLLLISLILSSCAGAKVLRYEKQQDQVWPSKPEQPRFSYVGQLTGERDFKAVGKSGAKIVKILKWIAGGLLGKGKPRSLQRPQSGLVDAQGRIYVSDVNRQAIYVFDAVTGKLKIWEWASKQDHFLAPIGMALMDNNLYVADSELGYVSVLDLATGEPKAKINDSLSRPTGLAIDSQTKILYVADTRKHDVKAYDQNGKLLTTFGHYGAKKGEFNGPTHLAFAKNRLYVADTLNARIQIFTAKGKFIRAIGNRGRRVGDFYRPKGIAVDSNGLIYVIESFYDHLLVFNQKGRLMLPIGGEGSGVGEFYLPAGVWVGANENVYIADMFNGRVVVLKYLEGV